MRKYEDLSNRRFGKLTVLYREGFVKQGRQNVFTWKCICDCGNETHVTSHELTHGHTKSCGCIRRERASKLSYKHGESHTSRLYREWASMKLRCYSKNRKDYINYGGRGIKVCEEWKDYFSFRNWALKNGYSDDLTLDRIDVNGNYEPLNCRWADAETQANNKRNSKFITYNGKRQTVSQWAKELNIPASRIFDRLSMGWSEEESLTIPPLTKGCFQNECKV